MEGVTEEETIIHLFVEAMKVADEVVILPVGV